MLAHLAPIRGVLVTSHSKPLPDANGLHSQMIAIAGLLILSSKISFLYGQSSKLHVA